MNSLPYWIQLAVPPALSLVLVLAFGSPMIRWLRRLGAGQRVRDDGPQRHMQKEGTPTMGGVLIVGAASVAAVTVSAIANRGWSLIVMDATDLAPLLAFGGVGLLDDWLKIARGRSLGLRARQKLGLQLLCAVGVCLMYGLLLRSDEGWASLVELTLGGAICAFLLLATSNAMNLTDGLDGLAAGLCAIAFVAVAAMGIARDLQSWGAVLADGGTLLALALAGACLGFLWFNRHPATVFMGDVGSLALGAALAALALRFDLWVLIGVCFVPFIEEASVVLQVVSFKTTGRRIFRMSPIHHHFELMGWSEWKVVCTFWAVGAVAAGVTVWLSVR